MEKGGVGAWRASLPSLPTKCEKLSRPKWPSSAYALTFFLALCSHCSALKPWALKVVKYPQGLAEKQTVYYYHMTCLLFAAVPPPPPWFPGSEVNWAFVRLTGRTYRYSVAWSWRGRQIKETEKLEGFFYFCPFIPFLSPEITQAKIALPSTWIPSRHLKFVKTLCFLLMF